MASLLTFPLDLDILSDNLRAMTVKRKLQGFYDTTMDGNGEILGTSLAPRIWQGTTQIDVLTFRQASELEALINSLDETQNSFYFSDPRTAYPWYDPDGSIHAGMGGTSFRLLDVSGDKQRIQIKNAADFKFYRGDLFHFDFGTDPVHRAFHQIVSRVETGDHTTGNTDWIEVRPPIRTGYTLNTILTFEKPALEIKIVPNTFEPGTAQDMVVSGMGFDWRQVV